MSATEAFCEELTCSICLDVFDNPRTLPCMHSFCTACLKDLKSKSQGLLKCPECRQNSGLTGSKTVEQLPKNYALANMASKYKEMSKISCSMCEGEPRSAVKTCLDCAKMSYCETCLLQFHPDRGKMKGHRLVSPTAGVQSSPQQDTGTKKPDTIITSRMRNPGVSRSSRSDNSRNGQGSQNLGSQGVRHPNVICDGCKKPVFGVRYKCRGCDNQDLCSQCEARGVHSQTHHDMIKVIEPKLSFNRVIYRLSSTPLVDGVHPNIRCDVCGGSVRGVRYHCCDCANYDLCKECEARGSHPEHDLRKIVTPKHFRNVNVSSEEAVALSKTGTPHPRVVCDACSGPVRGIRFKCAVCPDFDLCAKCLVQGQHSQHDMKRIDSP